MENDYFVALDLGTSFIKTGIYDKYGVCHSVSHKSVNSFTEGPGTYIQKAEDLFEDVVACLKRAIQILGEEKNNIRAIAFTGQMAGFMGVDKDWNDITTWSCSLDTRYVPFANKQMELLADEFLEISGTNAPLMAPKCEWFNKEFPQKAKDIEKYMMISGYVIGRLGNSKIEDATIDCSYITWTGLADLKKGTWSKELCEKVGVRVEQLPKIVKSYEICGHLSKEMAFEVGIASGIPLISGAGDKIAGCIGAGILNEGDMIFEASSYGAISCMVNTFIANTVEKSYDAIPAALSEEYYAHKYIPGSGITLKWFADNFCSKNEDWNSTFKEIDRKISAIGLGCDGLMAIGLLGGSAMPFDGELRGTFIGHTWNHKTEHFYKALLEGYGYEVALTIDAIEEMYGRNPVQIIKMIGGGANSAEWPQIMADICGREFQCLEREDVALWGTAMIAGYGVGLMDDLNEIAQKNVVVKRIYKPDMEKHQKYRQYKKIYAQLRKELHLYCEMLLKTNQMIVSS
ncbi:MAG: FGGY family carbohydrate kinase [Lachnospiraceae bacterium]|nr:FGGY family carbohydrate kinase [Lachnospiraceae bacterium]